MMKIIRKTMFALLCTNLMCSLLIGCNSLSQPQPNTEKPNTEKPNTQKPNTEKPNFEELVDFVVKAEEGREFRILQFTDTQIIDPGQSRYPERLGDTTPLSDEDLYNECFYYIEEAVKRTKPDLIIMTGDNVYGEFDDNGTSLQRLIAFMESLEIPWAPVFGNHDNESTKGVTWQCKQYEEAEHCLFKRGETSGNSNYSIGVVQGDKLIKVIYMLDSNGCTNGKSYSYMPSFGQYNQNEIIIPVATIGKYTINWIDRTAEHITSVLGYSPSKFAAFHIPLAKEFGAAIESIGYQENDNFTIDDPTGINFGRKRAAISGMNSNGLWEVVKEHNFDGIFVGHVHLNDFSIVYQGVRLTFGVKSSTFDSNYPDMLGGTLITVSQGGESFEVEHCYIDAK